MTVKFLSKKEFFSFLKIFVFCFAVVFLAINMGSIKKIFDYRIVYGRAEIMQIQEEATPQEEIVLTEKPDSIEISKIQITVPLVFVENSEKSVFGAALDRGVVHYPESALPGEKGQIIFLGHSAPLWWPKIKHDWVFSNLNDLAAGDEINIYFNGQKYTYNVEKKIILEKGEDLPKDVGDRLILLTCWPPGVDQRRLAVIAY